MIIIGMIISSALGAIAMLIYSGAGKSRKIISFCIAVAAVLVIAGVFAVDAINYKGNPYQERLGRYYSEECKPLVLSGRDTYGKVNIINCHETILQVDAAEYDAAVRAYRKSAQTQN
ncbi:hypothetical protein Q4R27_15995 [Morganella morganii subsp. sibonii]